MIFDLYEFFSEEKLDIAISNQGEPFDDLTGLATECKRENISHKEARTQIRDIRL